VKVTQEPACIGRRRRGADAHEDPACGPADRDEVVAAPLLVGHLRQAFHVHMPLSVIAGNHLPGSG
jgi:hypothetical protein